MTGYARKKRNNEVWRSKSFYTSDMEYKLELAVTPAGSGCGDDHGSYMGVDLIFTYEGSYRSTSYYSDRYESYYHDYETCTEETIIRKFEVQVLNQTSDNEHFSETQGAYLRTNYSGQYAWNSDEYISTRLLHRNTATCQYLKNDTIFFKVCHA